MDKEIEGMDVAVGAVGSAGEWRSSTLSTARDDEAVAALAPGQRWSLSRKREVVLRLMQGAPVDGLSRRLGLPVSKLEQWRQRGLAGIDAGLRERDDDPKERELAEAHRRIGALSMENELLRARRSLALWPAGGRADGRRDLAGDRAKRMACAGCARSGA